MQTALLRNYHEAVVDAQRRGARRQVEQVESLIAGSTATINVPPKILSSMVLGAAYRSYYKALDQDLRRIAEQKYHAHRAAVDAKVHPGYGAEILNAAINPDGRGLTNYGEITLRLRDISISTRASVLRENAFAFYERHDLGRRDAEEEPGWRATWPDRARLGVAHLGPSLTAGIADDDLSFRILTIGANRENDRYIEVHIYGELSCAALENVSLDRPLTNPDNREEWAFARQKLLRQGVRVQERIGP
jgi:hypothetical protein